MYYSRRQALARADVLLSMKHGMTRLDNVWGVGGGLRPVTSLVRSMGLLLQVGVVLILCKHLAKTGELFGLINSNIGLSLLLYYITIL